MSVFANSASFGSNNNSNSFGFNNNNNFSNNNSSAFGNNNSLAFGGNNNSSAFGSNNNSSAFGNNNSSAFGNNNSSAFGNNNNSSAFGNNNSFAFGNNNNNSSAFGGNNSSSAFSNNDDVSESSFVHQVPRFGDRNFGNNQSIGYKRSKSFGSNNSDDVFTSNAFDNQRSNKSSWVNNKTNTSSNLNVGATPFASNNQNNMFGMSNFGNNSNQQLPSISENKKQQACRYYKAGNCQFGTNCRFAHIDDNATDNIAMPKSKNSFSSNNNWDNNVDDSTQQIEVGSKSSGECRFFKAGHCQFGDDCKYAHNVKKVVVKKKRDQMPQQIQQTKKQDVSKMFNLQNQQSTIARTVDFWTLKIFKLPNIFSDQFLRKHFQKFGQIKKLNINRKRQQAFISYESKTEVLEAFKKSKVINGKRLKLQYMPPKSMQQEGLVMKPVKTNSNIISSKLESPASINKRINQGNVLYHSNNEINDEEIDDEEIDDDDFQQEGVGSYDGDNDNDDEQENDDYDDDDDDDDENNDDDEYDNDDDDDENNDDDENEDDTQYQNNENVEQDENDGGDDDNNNQNDDDEYDDDDDDDDDQHVDEPSKNETGFFDLLDDEMSQFEKSAKSKSVDTIQSNPQKNNIKSVSKLTQRAQRFAASTPILPKPSKVLSEPLLKQQQNDEFGRVALVGSCEEMCPYTEAIERQNERDLSVFERQPFTGDKRELPQVDLTKAVKKYKRSAADQIIDPKTIRTPETLVLTMNYLLTQVCDNDQFPYYMVVQFLSDRFRAIRKDYKCQRIQDLDCMNVLEQMARFHIYAQHIMCEESIENYDPVQNAEKITQCLRSLSDCYRIHPKSKNRDEFACYDMLIDIDQIPTKLQEMEPWLVKTKPVQFALEVYKSSESNDYIKYFSLLRSATYLQACLMHRYFDRIRAKAFRIMCRAYGKTSYPLSKLYQLLALNDMKEAENFVEHYNLGLELDRGGKREAIRFGTAFSMAKGAFPNCVSNEIEKLRIGRSVCDIVYQRDKKYGISDFVISNMDTKVPRRSLATINTTTTTKKTPMNLSVVQSPLTNIKSGNTLSTINTKTLSSSVLDAKLENQLDRSNININKSNLIVNHNKPKVDTLTTISFNKIDKVSTKPSAFEFKANKHNVATNLKINEPKLELGQNRLQLNNNKSAPLLESTFQMPKHSNVIPFAKRTDYNDLSSNLLSNESVNSKPILRFQSENISNAKVPQKIDKVEKKPIVPIEKGIQYNKRRVFKHSFKLWIIHYKDRQRKYQNIKMRMNKFNKRRILRSWHLIMREVRMYKQMRRKADNFFIIPYFRFWIKCKENRQLVNNALKALKIPMSIGTPLKRKLKKLGYVENNEKLKVLAEQKYDNPMEWQPLCLRDIVPNSWWNEHHEMNLLLSLVEDKENQDSHMNRLCYWMIKKLQEKIPTVIKQFDNVELLSQVTYETSNCISRIALVHSIAERPAFPICHGLLFLSSLHFSKLKDCNTLEKVKKVLKVDYDRLKWSLTHINPLQRIPVVFIYNCSNINEQLNEKLQELIVKAISSHICEVINVLPICSDFTKSENLIQNHQQLSKTIQQLSIDSYRILHRQVISVSKLLNNELTKVLDMIYTKARLQLIDYMKTVDDEFFNVDINNILISPNFIINSLNQIVDNIKFQFDGLKSLIPKYPDTHINQVLNQFYWKNLAISKNSIRYDHKSQCINVDNIIESWWSEIEKYVVNLEFIGESQSRLLNSIRKRIEDLQMLNTSNFDDILYIRLIWYHILKDIINERFIQFKYQLISNDYDTLWISTTTHFISFNYQISIPKLLSNIINVSSKKRSLPEVQQERKAKRKLVSNSMNELCDDINECDTKIMELDMNLTMLRDEYKDDLRNVSMHLLLEQISQSLESVADISKT